MGVGVVVAADEEAADDAGQDADGGEDQREHRARAGERAGEADAQGQGADQRADIAFKQVRAHAGHVADVVADVIGDDGGVARVVLGDAGLDLADQVRADVSGLGVDAAAHAGEQGDGACAQGEAGEDLHILGEDIDERRAEQTQAHDAHAHDGAAGEGHAQGAVHSAVLGGGGGADVGLGGHVHAHVAGGHGEDGADEEAHGGHPADEEADEQEQHDDEDDQDAVLREEEGARALGDGAGDLLHPFIAGVGLGHLGRLDGGEEQGDHGQDRGKPDQIFHKHSLLLRFYACKGCNNGLKYNIALVGKVQGKFRHRGA